MTSFDPAKAFQQVREENHREMEAAAEIGRWKSEAWADDRRRVDLLYQLLEIFPSDTTGGTADPGRLTTLMLKYGQTLHPEWAKARVASVNERLAKLTANGEHDPDAGLKRILLHLLLAATQGDKEKVAEIFTEALRSDPNDVQAFRRCLVNWLMDKVVDQMPPLPVELISHVETPAESQHGQEPVDLGATPVDSVVSDTVGTGLEQGRLRFDPLTQTVTLDGKPHKIENPKAFSVYQEIAKSCPNPLTKAELQKRVPGCKGDKKIRQLFDSLPEPLCVTVRSGKNGYWLDLNPPPDPGKRARRQKGRT